ncbi:MAG: hypothetical protein KGO21_10685 [Hyphomicrobiales bacterium]|nr:hypothetical protein [Hyphomicrobiales bacterium]
MNDFYINSERIKLVKRIGKGGEGEVFTISGEMPRVAKIYTIQDLKEREEKIKAMIKNHLAQNNNFVSFPIEIVLDGKKQFRGFTMKQIVSHKPIFELYAPGARKKNFPKSDYRFLVRTASNIARAVQSVHDINCVIGDINHSSILVSDKATVALIDADSFQFNINNQNYFCKVGVAEYTPPELHGSKLDQIVRTINHDSFGLAVIIFQLLFLGRHPFSGNFKDKDLTIAEAIQKNKFIYSIANRVEAEIPPAVPRLQDFSENIIQLFEKAFSEKKHRPAASAWVNALSDFEKTLIKCQKFETHYYPSFRKTCLWCDLELTSGVSIFPTKKNTTSINLKNHELINIFLNIEFVPFFPSDYIPPVSYQPRNEISKLKFFSKSRATLILVVLFLISLFTVKSAPILPVILFFATWIIPNILNSAEKEAKLIKEELDKIDLELNRIWTSYHSNRNLKELYWPDPMRGSNGYVSLGLRLALAVGWPA